MTQTFLIILAVLGLALGGTSYLLYQQIGRTAEVALERDQARADVQAALEAAERVRALSVRLAKEKRSTARESASLRQKLDAALAAQSGWAGQPVPQEVQDALK